MTLKRMIKLSLTAASISFLMLGLAACSEESRVRACLEKNAELIGGVDHVYLSEVVDVKRWRSFPDGTAMYFVKYRLQGDRRVHDTTCRW